MTKHKTTAPVAASFAALHANCFDGAGCTGPGCTIRRNRYSVADPRVRTRPTKAEKHLQARQAAWEQHGKNPRAGDNPSNSSGQGHDMHKPGSQKR